MNHTIKALAADVRKTILDRIQGASNADLFAIAGSMFANDELRYGEPFAVVTHLPRFTKLDLRGYPTTASDYVAVYDRETNLTFTRRPLECGAVNHKDAMTACANYRLFGREDWRAPTVKERVSINDYAKFGPAIYQEFDAGGATYEWTSEVDAESPSVYAWNVHLRNGLVSRRDQTAHFFVRAVRAGQPLELGL